MTYPPEIRTAVALVLSCTEGKYDEDDWHIADDVLRAAAPLIAAPYIEREQGLRAALARFEKLESDVMAKAIGERIRRIIAEHSSDCFDPQACCLAEHADLLAGESLPGSPEVADALAKGGQRAVLIGGPRHGQELTAVPRIAAISVNPPADVGEEVALVPYDRYGTRDDGTVIYLYRHKGGGSSDHMDSVNHEADRQKGGGE
jgi:hypothetical protein